MERMLGALATSVAGSPDAPKLLVGTGRSDVHLLVVVSADRGLCGGFNGAISRFARNRVRALEEQGKTVKILTIGRKARDYLRRDFARQIVGEVNFVGKKRIGFEDAAAVADRITTMLNEGEFDVCTLLYNRFQSVISQVPAEQPLIPASVPAASGEGEAAAGAKALYEYEPAEEEILASLLPQNLAIQIYRAVLESAAGEQGARMTAMDNATRNAGDMIARLTLNYNRQRQANITKELIEIISGAEAV
jgi:F-type H+-transporting ATPase subunit gamma